MTPKILIAVITSIFKDYCFEAWCQNLQSFTYQNKHILIVDNSRDPLYQQRIKKLLPDATVIWHPVKENQSIRDCMKECNNITRDYLLADPSYTHMLSLESDIFPHPDCIEQLISHKKLVVGFSYFVKTTVMSNMCLFYIDGFSPNYIEKPYHLNESFWYYDGTLKEGFQFGLGCILINSLVLEKIKFRCNLNADGFPDKYLHEDLYLDKIKAYVDTSRIVHHENKTTWGNIYKQVKK